jgi:hypothetical protein
MTQQVFVAGEKPTAAKLNAVSDQTVIVCTSSTRPASPTEGMVIVETDTDLMYLYSGSAWVAIGQYGALGSPGVAVRRNSSSCATSSIDQWSRKVGRVFEFGFKANLTATGTSAGTALDVTMSTLGTPAYSGMLVGHGTYYDSSATAEYPLNIYVSTTGPRIYFTLADGSVPPTGLQEIGVNPNFGTSLASDWITGYGRIPVTA